MSNRRVLIVDDDGIAVSLLSKILSTYGFDVTGTTNPFEGYELALEEYFDLILLDVMMPQLNGFALCRKIKQHEELQLIPVFFVTAYTAMDAELRAYEAGGDGIVAKPIEVQKIMSLLDRVVPPANIHSDNGFQILAWFRPHWDISKDKLPLQLGFFEFIHNVRARSEALLPSLLALLLQLLEIPIEPYCPSTQTAGQYDASLSDSAWVYWGDLSFLELTLDEVVDWGTLDVNVYWEDV